MEVLRVVFLKLPYITFWKNILIFNTVESPKPFTLIQIYTELEQEMTVKRFQYTIALFS